MEEPICVEFKPFWYIRHKSIFQCYVHY